MLGPTGPETGNRAPRPRHRSGTSIAVFPYTCVRDGKTDASFAARMTFLIIDALYGFADLEVISPYTMLAAEQLHWSPSHAASQLGVRFILTGEILCDDQDLTFSHNLYDTETQRNWALVPVRAHIGRLRDIELSIIPRIIQAILPDLAEIETERALMRTRGDIQARDLYLRAMLALHRLTPHSLSEAEHLLLMAEHHDPEFATAIAWRARIISLRVGQGWTKNPATLSHEAIAIAERAIAKDPNNALALATAGHMRSYLFRQFDEAIALFTRAESACPNEPLVWMLSSATYAYVGRGDEAYSRAAYALSLSPLDRFSYHFHSFAALAAYIKGDYAASASHANLSLQDNPNYSASMRTLASAYAAQGMLAEARRMGANLLKVQPDFPQRAEDLILFRKPEDRERIRHHLRLAGVLPPIAAT